MNVYTRPLFRQAGGPAQPMAQDMSQEIERVAGQLNYLNTMIAVEPNMSTKRQLMEAIQNLAQTTPPEVFNAASKLVRDAEASKSPDVMANPNMDPGNRSFVSPVNRANGGEIMPPAMQQGMAPPPEAAMLERAEMMASQQAEQLGAQYAQDMMQNVNSAESAEDLINAMRGNQMPLEARREELGGLVGMEDANATPESVLALVQPVIMMTEEGAINSGIGELMQGIIGDVEMTTEGGMPTEMGQGVGGLMMAGAQEAPAPQNFNQGGAVQSYALGGIAMPPAFAPMLDEDQDADLLQPIEVTATRREPMTTGQETGPAEMLLSGSTFGDSVKGYYNEMLPLYQEILGQTEDQKSYNKAQAYFDLAQAGLALASGTDPRTGKSVAGQPFGAQLATAASALPAAFQERAAEQRKLEQGVKSAALSGAMEQAQLEQKYLNDLLISRMATASRLAARGLDERVVLDKEGNEVAVLNVNNAADLAAYENYKGTGQYTFRKITSDGAESLTNYIIQAPDGSRELVESFDNGKTYIGPDGTAVKTPTGEGYSTAVAPPEQVAELQKSISSENKYRKILEDLQRGESSPSEGVLSDRTYTSSLISNATLNKQAIEEKTGEPLDIEEGAKAINAVKQSAYAAAKEGTGPGAGITAGIDKYFGFLQDNLDPDDATVLGARQYLRALRFIGKVALVTNPRFPVGEMQLASELFPDPDAFFANPESEALKLSQIKAVTDDVYEKTIRNLASGGLDSTQRREAENSLREIELLRTLVGDVPTIGQQQFAQNRFDLSGQRTTQPSYGTGVQ